MDLNTSNGILNRNYGLVLFIWTFLLSISCIWTVQNEKREAIALATNTALENFNQDQAIRFWAAERGGIYIPIDDKISPNPLLAHVAEQNITTPSGRVLTLMNPAWFLRNLMDDYSELYGVQGHITSLKPINSRNAADHWETDMLQAFENGLEKAQGISEIEGSPYVRYMQPMLVQENCLKCHAEQGYTVGDIRGGVSVSVPLQPYLDAEKLHITVLLIFHFAIWLFGCIAIFNILSRHKRHAAEQHKTFTLLEEINSALKNSVKSKTTTLQHTEQEKADIHHQLQVALAEIKTLQGIIPICSSCKNIRTDHGAWEGIEIYISSHSESKFSHGICPACAKKLYPDVNLGE